MPMTAIRIGTSAEIGALTKILTHMPRILPMVATLAMTIPMGIPISSATPMPSAKERKEIDPAVLNFWVGMMVIPAAITRENGGMIVDNSVLPMMSQTTNQTQS